jgi:hypothetical protein
MNMKGSLPEGNRRRKAAAPKPDEDTLLSKASRRIRRVFFETDIRDLLTSSGSVKRPLEEQSQGSSRTLDQATITMEATSTECQSLNDSIYTYRDAFDHLGNEGYAYREDDEDFRAKLFRDMQVALRRMRDHVYGGMRADDPLADFCHSVLSRTDMIPYFYRKDKSLDDYVLTCVKLALPDSVSLPPEMEDETIRETTFRQWESMMEINVAVSNMHFFLRLFHRVLTRYEREVYKKPAKSERRVVSASFVRERDVNKTQKFYEYLDECAEAGPSKIAVTDYMPEPNNEKKKAALEILLTLLPKGMDTRALFRTPFLLKLLWEILEAEGVNLQTTSVGDVLTTLIPHTQALEKRYLEVSSARAFVKNDQGRYDSLGNCLKHVLLWSPFHEPEIYAHNADFLHEYETSYTFGEAPEPFKETSVGVNEHELLTLAMTLYRLCKGDGDVRDILRSLASDINHRHFIKENSTDPTPVLLERLKDHVKVANMLFRDIPLVQFLHGFVHCLETYPVEIWGKAVIKRKYKPRDLVRDLARNCFKDGEDGQQRREEYEEIVFTQVKKWDLLNEPAASRSSDKKSRFDQLCRRIRGWLLLHGDMTQNFFHDVIQAHGIDLAQWIYTKGPERVEDKMRFLQSDPDTAQAFNQLFTDIREGVVAIHYPHWRVFDA